MLIVPAVAVRVLLGPERGDLVAEQALSQGIVDPSRSRSFQLTPRALAQLLPLILPHAVEVARDGLAALQEDKDRRRLADHHRE